MFPVCYLSEPRRICGKRHRTNPTMDTRLRDIPINTHGVPGNNQTPNNTVIAPAVSDALSLSVSHNKSLFDRPVQCMCSTGGSLLLLLNTKLYYWRLHPAQCLLIPPPVSVLILEMFSVANKSIMPSYTCSICKWIALAHIASDGNQKNIVLWEKEIASPILSVIVLNVIWWRCWKWRHTVCKLNATLLGHMGCNKTQAYETAGTNYS